MKYIEEIIEEEQDAELYKWYIGEFRLSSGIMMEEVVDSTADSNGYEGE